MRRFGDLLRRHRIAAGLTQGTLAERAGMSLAAIGKLERGARQRPYPATIDVLAEVLSLSSGDHLELQRAANRGTHVDSNPVQEEISAPVHLPVHFSTFVGRESDLEHVREMLSAHRLCTLVGAGGVGKTRLAVRAAEEFTANNPTGSGIDGVWFVDLSMLADGTMLPLVIASNLGLDHCRTLEALITYLRPQSFLLILDNCEHLLDPVARAVNALVSGCPQGWILITSRQALSVEGERIYQVPPMNFPAAGVISAKEALEFDAIRLFKDRAEATNSRFELTDSVTPAVISICRRVDGIALAIELAAARTNAFSPATLAQQIGEHLSLLTGGGTALPRHKTMNALFDWSYDLLDEPERELFRRSSLFTNGFTLDLLRSLCAEMSREVPSVLASLVNKSFVLCDILVEPTRYRLLEPARQYAREKLTERGEYGDTARSHARALLTLAEGFDARLDLIPDVVWDEYIERERDNFRTAFEWALAPGGDALIGQRLAASNAATWIGFESGEVRKWLHAALASLSPATPPSVSAKLAISAARTSVIFGPTWDSESTPLSRVDACRRALALQPPDDSHAIATAQFWLGVALQNMGHYDEADAALRDARETARVAGAQTVYNAATTSLGSARYGSGDLQEARALISEALARSEAARSDRDAADARVTLAEIEFASGDAERALELSEQTAQFFRTHSNWIRLPMTLNNSSAYLIALERFREARELAREALKGSLSIGSVNAAFWAMQHLAAVAVLGGARDNDAALHRAAHIFGFVDETTERRGKHRYYTEQQEYEKVVSTLRTIFGEEQLAQLMADGKAWSEAQAVAEAFLL